LCRFLYLGKENIWNLKKKKKVFKNVYLTSEALNNLYFLLEVFLGYVGAIFIL